MPPPPIVALGFKVLLLVSIVVVVLKYRYSKETFVEPTTIGTAALRNPLVRANHVPMVDENGNAPVPSEILSAARVTVAEPGTGI